MANNLGRFNVVLGQIDDRTKLGQLRAHYFPNNVDGLATFLNTLFPVDSPWVILSHHGAFVEWWGMLMRKLRIHPAGSCATDVVCVRYTRAFAQINGSVVTGDVRYPLPQIVELVAYMLLSSTADMPNAQRFASAFDVPLMLINALLRPETPPELYDAFCRDWVDLGAHDLRYIQLYRECPDVLREFYAEPIAPSSNSGSVMLRDYGRLLRANKLGEWWARQRRCAGTSLIRTLDAFFDLECKRITIDGLDPTELNATGAPQLQHLFPFALALALGTTTGDDEYGKRLISKAPTVAKTIQGFVDAARVFMIDQLGDLRVKPGLFDDGMWDDARSVCATLRNIRTCIDPQIEAMERFENASWDQAAADTNTRDGRAQRMIHHAAQRLSLYDFIYDTLCRELNNVIETAALMDWVHSTAFYLAQVSSPQSCSRQEAITTPSNPNVQQIVRTVAKRFVVLSFFGTNGWPAATLFSLRCTMKALQTHFPEIGLADPGSHFMGHCQHGPYLVLERQVLWMVIHASSTLALMSQQRCFQKTTPYYPELLRTYFSRMDLGDERAQEMRTVPSAWSCLWIHDSGWSTPPATLNPNIFSHMCFINILCEWLDIPVEVVYGHKWRRAVPPPETPGFAATRMLHRFVDQLHQGAVSDLVAAGAGHYQYWIDDDDHALNAIKSFLQMDAPHTISVYMLQRLSGVCQRNPERFSELAAILALIEPFNSECRRDINAWISTTDVRYRASVAIFGSTAAAAAAASSSSSSSNTPSAAAAAAAPPRKRKRTQKKSLLHELLNESVPSSSLATTVTTPAVAGVPKARRRAELDTMDIGVEREHTDAATAELLLANELTNVDDETREYASVRVAILPTNALIARLPANHSLHRLWQQSVDPRRLLAHINMLLYEPLLCNLMPLGEARRLACDLQVGGRRIVGATLFAEPRYSGGREDALRNFREMHATWESTILNVQDDPTGRLLAYTQNEPRDQLYTLFRHLDYRHTLGDTSPGHGINVAIDSLFAQSAPPERLIAPLSSTTTTLPTVSSLQCTSTRPASAELPSCMSTVRPHLYPSNSMVLITTMGESHLAEHVASYSKQWEFASHIASVIHIDAKARSLQTTTPNAGEWIRRVTSKINKQRHTLEEDIQREDMRLENATSSWEAAATYLGL